MEARIRIFISYSHKDKALAKKIAHAIEKNKMAPLWDENLTAGTGFPDEIKYFISQSHIFIPLLTESSSKRCWVHQEIGYAMALHIPVYPLTTENITPGGMLQMIQAMKIDNNEQNLLKLLNRETFQALIRNSKPVPLFECAHLPQERSKMMADYCNKLVSIDKFGIVRQKGGLSSFHIPFVSILKKVWNDRYFPEHRSDHHKSLQRDERISLQKHSDNEGCRLIINPAYATQGRSKLSSITRLQTLIDFLNSPSGEETVIAIQNNPVKKESLTIVGDWFVAESVSFKEGDGFTNTFFTRDVSEINRRIEEFESEMEDILQESGWKEKDSRDKAIEKLTDLQNDIKE
jgi:hypothetical protein